VREIGADFRKRRASLLRKPRHADALERAVLAAAAKNLAAPGHRLALDQVEHLGRSVVCCDDRPVFGRHEDPEREVIEGLGRDPTSALRTYLRGVLRRLVVAAAHRWRPASLPSRATADRSN
jgi:hypothetical protein